MRDYSINDVILRDVRGYKYFFMSISSNYLVFNLDCTYEIYHLFLHGK